MNSTRIQIPLEKRENTIVLLNQLLADLSDLYSQAKQAHWNIRGHSFYSLHRLFDDVSEVIGGHLDKLAERIATLGGVVQGTISRAAAHSRLSEFPSEQDDDSTFLRALIERFAYTANTTREAINQTVQWGDATTADLLTGISRDLDKSLWMLEAHDLPA